MDSRLRGTDDSWTLKLNRMNYSLRYRLSRFEVWRWYWAAWRARLWRFHILAAVILAIVLPDILGIRFVISSYILCFFAALPVVTLLLALWPQVMFKSKERTLLVGPEGWVTKIGNKSGSRRWTEIASVHEAKDSVVITSTTGNALIVPARAFANESLKAQFVKDSQDWHRGLQS
jgi:hypothetical protein